MKLRSNFEPGTTRWAVRRAQWMAMGYSEEDMLRPKIAIVNTSSKLSVCFAHLDDVARAVEEAIREAGGLPFEIRTAAPSDFITSAGKQARYLMPTRDLLANDIEVQVEGAVLDAMVLLASCDKTTPGQLMAAARLDIPAIVVPCGYQLGAPDTERTIDIEEVYKSVGAYKAGAITLEDLTEMTKVAIRGPGVCAGLATANTMHVLTEALGMCLPGSAPVRAGSGALMDNARAAGRRIVEMITEDLRAREILTPAAFRNAVRMAVATGCSVNCVRHLTAIAAEGRVAVDVLAELEAARHLPQITVVRPNGPHRVEDLDAAGGCRAVLKQLSPELDLTVKTVSGKMLGDVLASAPDADGEVIRPLERPHRAEPGLVVLRGSLAPKGAVVKLSAVPVDVRRFAGPARVYEDENEAIAALERKEIAEGDVVVLRLMGPMGGPGTVFAASFMAALVGAGYGNTVAVVTDGELSGLNSGITIGQVMPEAAEGGPLAVVRDGDTVAIDLHEGTLHLNVGPEELQSRLAGWTPAPESAEHGWLNQYRRLVRPLDEGAVLAPRG